MMPQPTEQWVQMVLISSVLPPDVFAASAFFIITGDTVVASAAPPAIRLEFFKKERREIAPGINGTVTWVAGCAATAEDVLVNFLMTRSPLNVSRFVIIEHVLG